jgi:hypothetical protein
MYPVKRSSQRLDLRELSVEDVDAVFAIYGSIEATTHLSFKPRSHAEVGTIVARSVASATVTPRTEYALTVIERDATELIGFGRIAADPHQQRGATCGFALRPDTWGVGSGVVEGHVNRLRRSSGRCTAADPSGSCAPAFCCDRDRHEIPTIKDKDHWCVHEDEYVRATRHQEGSPPSDPNHI